MYFSNLLALWSFQWVLPAKMYFSAAVVSWTKASICSCRLRHQLQIDFITHSNPQLGIANANLMRTRNPKQVYIVFCRALCGEPPTKWFQHRQLFAETFSCSIFASQQFSDFVDQMLPVGSHRWWVFTQRNGDGEVDEPETRLDLAAASLRHSMQLHCWEKPYFKWATLDQWPVTSDHEATSSNQWHHYVLWHMILFFVYMTIDKTDME